MQKGSPLTYVVGLIFFCCTPLVFSQNQNSELDLLMQNFFKASNKEEVKKAIDDIKSKGLSATEIEKKLKSGRLYSASVTKEWQLLYNKCSDGEERPYHLFVPKDYDPNKKYPLLYDLHGGINHGPFPTERMMARRNLWGPTAEENDFLIIIPHGGKKASWFNKLGTDNLIQQLNYAKKNYNVDENKVFISGFSDGASGSFWIGLHRPTNFAGFIPLSGNIAVARMGPYQCYPRNLINRPIHATNGGQDNLYPSKFMEPAINQLKAIGVKINWTNSPNAGHDLNYLSSEQPNVVQFLNNTTRSPNPKSIIWETAHLETNRCDWIEINELKAKANADYFKEVNLKSSPSKVLLGIMLQTEFFGIGASIREVNTGSLAEKIGLLAGDIITKVDEKDITGYENLIKLVRQKKYGESILLTLDRNGETKTIKGQFPEFEAKNYFRRELPSAIIEATTEGNTINIKTKNVAKYTLFLSRDLFNLENPIRVLTNGVESFNAKVNIDLDFMLEQTWLDQDRSSVYPAKIEINISQD